VIIYQADKRGFLHHALYDDIEQVLLQQMRGVAGQGVAQPQMAAWKHSLMEMAKVLHDDEIPNDVGVAIEYQLPQSGKRIDFLITGQDALRQPKVVIVELKQWSKARVSDKDGLVWAHRGGRSGETEGLHPSYQAWSYAAYLEDFNTAVQEGPIGLQPCAYLHNYPRDGQIDHPHYAPHLERAPLFLAQEKAKLQRFIREHVRYGDQRHTLYAIENGRIQPSKVLADAVGALLQGKPEFVLLDDQKVVYETCLHVAQRAEQRKQVVIVRGGPGTGKSVVALNLMGSLLRRQKHVSYVSKNAAPRAVYAARLTGTMSKTRFHNLFRGSGSFMTAEQNSHDVLIVDEAHRLNEKSGLYRNQGEHQVKELMQAARCSIFFVDDDQVVTVDDVGHSEALQQWAERLGAEVTELELASQFRCSGSDGYLAWLDDVLDIRETANPLLNTADYDLRVVDSPAELHQLIEQKNAHANRSRVVAGYCWTWPSKKDPEAWDIEMPAFNYRRRWNLSKDGSLWIMAPNSVAEVGCIHTCQGLELDYVGVIIGPDLRCEAGRIVTDVSQRARSDQSVKGLKSRAKVAPEEARELADRIIKNTYRTLMTRGMKGCFVYCTDPALATLLRSRLEVPATASAASAASTAPLQEQPAPGTQAPSDLPDWPLHTVSEAERAAGTPAIPVLALKFAAGSFGDVQSLDDGALAWVAPPDWLSLQPGLFVAQVQGESMNRRIPNGAWCLFRANPAGTRNGKVVVAEHHSIDCPDTGGRYTVKVYHSEKQFSPDGEALNTRITLSPDTTHPGYEPIVITPEEGEGVRVVAELLVVL
jgi:uncharacterized protein